MTIFVFACLAALYFVPLFIGHTRDASHATSIALLNMLLGWTFLGWIAALVWAVTDQPRHRAKHVTA